jgi:hypothetical protein
MGLLLASACAVCACLSIDTSNLTTRACAGANDACHLVPAGWEGPVAVLDRNVECPPALPNVTFERGTGIVAPPATCDCTCGPISGGTCTGLLEASGGSTCSTDCSEAPITMGPTTCRVVGTCNGAQAQSARVYAVVATPPTCGEPNVTTRKTPPSFERTLRACAPTTPSAQEGCAAEERCAPTNVGPLCVVHAGEVTCPAAYPNRVITYGDTQDERGCGACTCSPTDLDCEGGFIACRGGVVPTNGCIAGSLFVEYTGATVRGTCTARVAPIGSAIGIDPLTVCCER